MDYLNNILDYDTITNIIKTFDSNLLNNLDETNIKKIIKYLQANNIDYIEDILGYHTDLFSMKENDFIQKFEKLKATYGPNFCTNLAYKLDLLERMWEI